MVDAYNVYGEGSWDSVFVPPYEDEYAPTSGGVSQGGTQNIVGSIDQSISSPKPSSQQYEILNPEYLPGGRKFGEGPYSAANDPVGAYYEKGYDISLKKTGGGAPSGGAAKKPYATVGYSKTVYPSGAIAPKFAPPAYEESELKKRARKLAAPQRAELELTVKKARDQHS